MAQRCGAAYYERPANDSRAPQLNVCITALPFAPAAERCVRTQRSAAFNPQRSGGVSRGKGESKEGPRWSRAARLECGCRAAARNTGRVSAQCGAGNRNPPGPPWPPEAATRCCRSQQRRKNVATNAAKQRQNVEQHEKHPQLRQSAALERIALPPPTPQRSGGGTQG